MRLTLDEAATKLGKSARQVRYLVSTGRLAAHKIGGRWFVDTDKLPLSTGQEQALDRRERQLRAAVDDALEIDRERPGRRYSVRDMKAFQLTMTAYTQARTDLGDEHPGTRALKHVLEHLTRGCHRFDKADKAAAYREARDFASNGVCELWMDAREEAHAVATMIEQDVLAALAGLLRRMDRKVPR